MRGWWTGRACISPKPIAARPPNAGSAASSPPCCRVRLFAWAIKAALLAGPLGQFLPPFRRMAALAPRRCRTARPRARHLSGRGDAAGAGRCCAAASSVPPGDRPRGDPAAGTGWGRVVVPTGRAAGALNQHMGLEASANASPRPMSRPGRRCWRRAGSTASPSPRRAAGTLVRTMPSARPRRGLGVPRPQAGPADPRHLRAGRGAGLWGARRSRWTSPVARPVRSARPASDGARRAPCWRAGFRLTPVAEGHLCCGSGRALQPAPAGDGGRTQGPQVAALTGGAPQVIASGNIGCLEHLRSGTATPLVHTVELLDWAAGGERPARADAFAINWPLGSLPSWP